MVLDQKKWLDLEKFKLILIHDGLFSRINIGYKIRSFHNEHDDLYREERWIKQELFTEFRLKSNDLRRSPFQNIQLRTIKIDDFEPDVTLIWPPQTARKTNYYGEIAYQLKNRQILKPKELKLNYIYGFNKRSKFGQLPTINFKNGKIL